VSTFLTRRQGRIPTPRRPTVPVDGPAAGARAQQLVALRSGVGVALVATTVLASMVGFLDANVISF
jgi:hypothetical protein